MCSYNSHKTNISTHLKSLGNIIDHNLPRYDMCLLIGDFNAEITEKSLENFSNIYRVKNLVKEHTCFKNSHKSSCIDLLLIKCSKMSKIHKS